MSMALLLPTAVAFTTSSSLIPFPATTAIIRRYPSSSSSRVRRPAPQLLGLTHSSSTALLSSSSSSSSAAAATIATTMERRANQPTELPDSLDDAASIAANACYELHRTSGISATNIRCRVDFDTSIGDETYTLLKSSTEFTQKFVSSLCAQFIDGVRAYMLECASRLATARVELEEVRRQLLDIDNDYNTEEEEKNDDEFGDFLDEEGTIIIEKIDIGDDKKYNDGIDVMKTNNDQSSSAAAAAAAADYNGVDVETKRQLLVKREMILLQTIANGGSSSTAASSSSSSWTGPKVRVYFPDEGSAALARRDWSVSQIVPPCVEFGSVGGQQPSSTITAKDVIIIFVCPRASESDDVERILYNAESRTASGGSELLMSIMINPLLVDMGVTGFGMAGRRLRERLIDGLIPAYYLRTLSWGAITCVWPQLFTIWKEDENAIDGSGYSMLQAMDRLPSNPEGE